VSQHFFHHLTPHIAATVMKKVIELYYKYEEECKVFLIINVIALLLMNLFANSDRISVKDILTAGASVASTFFVFLAFRQTKLSNELKISDAEYHYLDRIITAQETKAEICVFSSDDIKYINSSIGINIKNLEAITYVFFIDGFNIVFRILGRNGVFKKSMEILDGKRTASMPDDELFAIDALRLSTVISRIRSTVTDKILYNFVELFSLYNQVHNSALIYSHKKLLINRLDAISTDYSAFNRTDLDEEEQDKKDYLLNFNMFGYYSNEHFLIPQNSGFLPENFGQTFNFEDIKSKYIN
jgi:hypothetical protein